MILLAWEVYAWVIFIFGRSVMKICCYIKTLSLCCEKLTVNMNIVSSPLDWSAVFS